MPLGKSVDISIPTAIMLDNDKAVAQRLVQAWIEIHRQDLLVDWKLAVAGDPVFKIDPLL